MPLVRVAQSSGWDLSKYHITSRGPTSHSFLKNQENMKPTSVLYVQGETDFYVF